MIMKQLTILLFLLSLAATAVGQTIRGRVVDDDSGEPLSAASVYVRSIGKGTTSDGDGYFSLQVADGKTVELRVSYVGYKDAAVQAKPSRTPIEVRLQRANELRGVWRTA